MNTAPQTTSAGGAPQSDRLAPKMHSKGGRALGFPVVVGIATAGRHAVIAEAVRRLGRQTLIPDHVIVSIPEGEMAPDFSDSVVPVSVVVGKRGGTFQRNRILEELGGKNGCVVFLDDDFVLADRYLEKVARLFQEHSEIVGLTGGVLADGIHGAGLSFSEADAILGTARDEDTFSIFDMAGVYGCNMSFRLPMATEVRFDENLPVYGWQEDIDFSCQIRRFGRVVKVPEIAGVHLGVKSGRTSGLRFGYSQVANPIYLVRKGTMSSQMARDLVVRNVAANLFRSFSPEPHIDRRGRLRGNLVAFAHLVTGRLHPTRILCLKA